MYLWGYIQVNGVHTSAAIDSLAVFGVALLNKKLTLLSFIFFLAMIIVIMIMWIWKIVMITPGLGAGAMRMLIIIKTIINRIISTIT